jgi:hypothetical protein
MNTVYGPNAAGANDPAFAHQSNAASDAVNSAVDTVTYAGTGYHTTQVANDNPFYRNNAQYMPGWGNTFGLDALDPNGVPSGAMAQDRATNYVGGNDPTGIWAGVRQGLVDREGAAIDALPKDANGNPVGNIGFGDVYNAHVDAYHQAQQDARDAGTPGAENAGNPFVDPLSFGLAMYGAPLLEHAGIDTGGITGSSIDFFNDPTDSVGEGWAKRAGLGLAEMGAGMAIAGPLGALPGAFSLAWNTGTAVNAYAEQQHLFGDDDQGHGLGVTQWAGQEGAAAGNAVADFTGSETVGAIADTAVTGLATVGGGIYAGGAAVADAIGSGVSALGNAAGSAVSAIASW